MIKMSEVRVIPHEGKRIESGPVQFGDDWPGVFFRGDHALYYGHTLRSWIDAGGAFPIDLITKALLDGLADDLLSCAVKPDAERE